MYLAGRSIDVDCRRCSGIIRRSLVSSGARPWTAPSHPALLAHFPRTFCVVVLSGSEQVLFLGLLLHREKR